MSDLPRTLEPEVMDSYEDAADYDAMDHAEVNRAFAADFLAAATAAGVALDAACEVLDVGAGTALIPIELCRRGLQPRIVAIDLAREMLRLGERNVAESGLGAQILLEPVDAKSMHYSSGRFRAAISNSIIHHISDPAQVVAEIDRVTAPGGLVFVRDLLRPADLATLEQLVDAHTTGANAHQRRLFADSLHAALTLDEMRELVAPLGYDRTSVAQTSNRHWTWSARKPG